jgi:hypothetical protein
MMRKSREEEEKDNKANQNPPRFTYEDLREEISC